MPTVDLVCLKKETLPGAWGLGRVLTVSCQTETTASEVEQLTIASGAAAVLFWDPSMGVPNQSLILELVASPFDCWHAGLSLGTGGLPGILDFISPTWMLSCDPPSDIEATSWRLSLRACLVRTEVLRRLGGPRPEFQTLEAASLEMGHRWIRCGALMRHVPQLLDHGTTGLRDYWTPSPEVSSKSSVTRRPSSALPFEDELRFSYYRFGRKWAAWAAFRAIMTHHATLSTALRAWRTVTSAPRPADPPPLRVSEVGGQRSGLIPPSLGSNMDHAARSTQHAPGAAPSNEFPAQPATRNSQPTARVSVLIPTLDRYPYLRVLLDQLRHQTVKPLEIIIVDQTAAGRREPGLFAEFADLPLRVIYQDEPGQCTSRNAGLQIALGDYVLFIDDDDEVQPDLIAAHLHTLEQFRADVSSGVADEVGAGPLPPDFCLARTSDVFPTNNTMIRRAVLQRSGLFDLAYNRRQRADGDLGMRVYLSGARMVLNPAISVLHHHAPAGGLRKHKARTVTYAMSRNSVFCRALTSASEIYLAGRYFPPTHQREMLWQSILGTFSIRGGPGKRLAKTLVSTVFLPQSIARLRSRIREATEMAATFPQIPKLQPAEPMSKSVATCPDQQPAVGSPVLP